MTMFFRTTAIVLALGTPAAFAQAPAKAPAKAPGAALTLSVEVTDRSGNALADVAVAAAGPVERSGSTSADGTVVFRSMRAGTYRLRFEREGYTTLERDVVIAAKPPARVSAALTAAPAAPAAPEPPEAPPPAATEVPARNVEPMALSIPDFLDKHLIGGQPQRITVLACAAGGTARLLQVRDPLNDQRHDDADELIYVVAGAGVMRIRDQDTRMDPGFFALVPRGVSHSLRRAGRNPLIALSIHAGSPCLEGDPEVR